MHWLGEGRRSSQSLLKSLLMFEMSKIPLFTSCLRNSSFWMQPLYLPTWMQLSFSEVTDWVCWICYTRSFATYCVSMKCAASDDCFSKRNLWSSSCNSRTLVSDPPLESHLTSVHKTYVFCIHLLRELWEQMWVKGTYFNVVNFDHIL